MDFEYNDDVPNSIVSLAKALDGCGIGKFCWRSTFNSRYNVLPTVCIRGISYGVGLTSYSTDLADMVSGMSCRGYIEPCQRESYKNLRHVSGDGIVSKYGSEFDTMHIYECNGVIVAICDMEKREIFLPDYSLSYTWSEYTERYIEDIVRMVNDIKCDMETFDIDRLGDSIERIAKNNTHTKVTSVEVETSFDKDDFVRDCMKEVISYEERTDARYKTVFSDMENKMLLAQGTHIGEAIQLINRMKKTGFSFVSPELLKYNGGKIVANSGIHGNHVYETLDEMWISGFKLLVSGGRIVGARYHRAHHPNCASHSSTVCIGDLHGIPMEDAWKVVESMKLPNFGGGYWENPSSYLGKKISDICGDIEMLWRSDNDE